MTEDNDLVKQLRMIHEWRIGKKAADRIEELQSRLRWVIQERDDTFARMLQRAEDAEAKLAKAATFLDDLWVSGDIFVGELNALRKELKGDKP